MKFKCSKCGQEHEGWPAIAFDMPHYYNILSLASLVFFTNEGTKTLSVKNTDKGKGRRE